MPRPKPSPENAPKRTTVSLKRKVSDAATKAVNPDKPEAADFSAVVEMALREYLDRHYPGLIERSAAELRTKSYAERPADSDARAAEEADEPARVETDHEGRVTRANAAFVALCGHTLEEMRGRKPGDVLGGPATEPEAKAKLRRAIAARRAVRVQLTNYRKDGAPYRVELQVRPTETGFVGEARKISD